MLRLALSEAEACRVLKLLLLPDTEGEPEGLAAAEGLSEPEAQLEAERLKHLLLVLLREAEALPLGGEEAVEEALPEPRGLLLRLLQAEELPDRRSV